MNAVFVLILRNRDVAPKFHVPNPLPQDGHVHPIAPPAPGGGDIQAARHRRHAADGQPNGEGAHRVQRSAAVDEGRVPGTGPRHL